MDAPAADVLGVWRHERKFVVHGHDVADVERMVRLHTALLRVAYPPRHVNSLYFDRGDRRAYWDSVDGVEQRVKVRARWYGPALGDLAEARLEFKFKHGQLGRKETFPLPPLALGERIERLAARQWLRSGQLSAAAREAMAQLEPVLLNRYWRAYYVSPDGSVRLTIDSAITARHVGPTGFLLKPAPALRAPVVVEMKYAPEHEPLARTIADALPFRPGRSSKFVSGLERW